MALTTSTRTTKSTDERNSRYVQGGTTSEYNTRLGWWERRDIPKEADDITVTVGPHEAGRADLIAYRIYKKANLAWLVLQYNNIVDPSVELYVGAELLLPSQSRVTLNILTKPTGGTKVK